MMIEQYNEESLFAERSVLGGLMLLSDPDSELMIKSMYILKEASFYKMVHRQIFKAIKMLFLNKQFIDLVTVEKVCNQNGDDTADLFLYLAQVIKETPSAANIISYTKIVREMSIERFTTNKLQNLIGQFTDKSEGDVYQRLGLLETTIKEIMNMSMRNEKTGLKHATEALGLWLDNFDQIQADGYDRNAFSTGIESLDDALGEKLLRRGSLVGVGARPKMGKSAFMALIANHFSMNKNETVAIFSMEMPNVEVVERSITSRSLVNPSEFYRSHLSNESAARRESACSDIIHSNIYIDDSVAITMSHIESESRKLRKEKGSVGLICVDYLTLMKAGKAERNDLAYGEITKALKNLAKELNCVVLLLLQLNRGLENRTDKRPMPSDSRDTGQIEQDVDVWIGLYKESVYNEEVESPGLTEVIVRLNRHGGTGTGFVEMRQGFHVPVSMNDGAKIINIRQQQISDSEDKEKKPFKYSKRK